MIALQYWFEKGFILKIWAEAAGLGWVDVNAGRLGVLWILIDGNVLRMVFIRSI